ncbi:DISARM system helicase DrmA [Paenarthrobacter sp. YJN-D]|uniref:DISARM system helicase DrmA n=1 Tax=Paenarthrobacter sp. YJN-D TaxID=2735317 RepID=UPI001878C548|nr:DISARM system helicase DrmA [Paenarthrobacter sp. YJN-D]QOT21781.1 helicase [Paenarthrobacter sp. YJN-D]
MTTQSATSQPATSAEVRDELVDLLHRDLIGPWGGPDETVKGTPRARYLVGALAPIAIGDDDPLLQAKAQPDVGGPDDFRDSDFPAVQDADARREVKGVLDEPDESIADSGGVEADEDRGPESKLIAPSSMGLRFQVGPDVGNLIFTARWGQYKSRRETDEDGRTQTFYERTDHVERRPIDIAAIGAGQTHTEVIVEGHVAISVEVFDHDGLRVVEAALQNTKVTGKELPPKVWLFQTQLEVSAEDGSAVFRPTRDALEQARDFGDPEVLQLDLLYRDRLEFAVGRTTSATWTLPDAQSRTATAVGTTWLPTAEVPQTLAPTIERAEMSMRLLMEASPDQLGQYLTPLLDGYEHWINDRRLDAAALPERLQNVAESGIQDGEDALKRLRAGLGLLTNTDSNAHASEQARKAFAFMNRTMRDQRIRSQIAALRNADRTLTVKDATAAIEAKGDGAASWRAFQLAFILMQLPSIVDPTLPRRSGDLPRAELLFFPTGGGKTEAYLGLAAFTFGIRRLQGVIETPGGLIDGHDGVAVLMRYTLRLLTSQQFLRATTLMCAAEVVRRENPATWGQEPFRIGLWVGSSVSPKRFAEAEKQVSDVRDDDGNSAYGLTVLQFSSCPWCGTPINPKADVVAVKATQRIHVYCGDKLQRCPFSAGGSAMDGLPVLTVDDEIYRNPPTFLLATVDKFARLAREGEAASLFGYVSQRCERHGYKHPDTVASVCGASGHTAKSEGGRTYPKAIVKSVDRLRPPDLIIQDELHLITGALGTAVGLFEGAIDTLSTWEYGSADRPALVKPLVIASTATVRNARDQVMKLYARQVQIFPPQVLSVTDTFFSKEVPISEKDPGRRYVGVCAHGARLTLAEIRVSEILLLAGQKLFDAHGGAAEPYATLVDYFSATRELAGMRRYLEDDIVTRTSNPDKDSGYPRRGSTGLRIGELTSRISSADISKTLTTLGVPFDPQKDTTAAKRQYAQLAAAAKKARKKLPPRDMPYDVVLATSMLQVGVDVPRLGLMLVVGQPKNTAEYIQATSRVGREASKPGLVVTLANRSRPRDMAHYEQFEHYHDTFYAHVEALSVTPFSDSALERGLTGVLVSAARVADQRNEPSLSPETGAGAIAQRRTFVDTLVDRLVTRIRIASGGDDAVADAAKSKLILRLDKWTDESDKWSGALTYQKDALGGGQIVSPLLVSPETVVPDEDSRLFQVANSMREVQPEINLLVTPIVGRLAEPLSAAAPKWVFSKKDAK